MRTCLLLPLLTLAAPALGDCRLALALAADVSRSIDAADFVIQTEGLAAALEDAEVRAAIFEPDGTVALAVYQWSGPAHQELIQPWVVLDGPDKLDAAIWAIRRAQRPEQRQATALGEALRYGADLLAQAPPCARQVLDVAGDGRNNEGVSVATIYARDPFDGITVNALAIGEHELNLTRYFRDEVIRGPGAFVELAPRQIDYPQAIRRKLLRELEGPQIGLGPAPQFEGGKT
ncbi:DUF1194 domain-containing protein [Tabrizicola aquatica]|uniref:DUF1194 domain-containing protein n=1 Tax=Tabrizicola aquatica TaxID=909926 RepID=UPI000CD25DF6|nr:DUF1194 domain-containing protein [Tabrizicola aquatica]